MATQHLGKEVAIVVVANHFLFARVHICHQNRPDASPRSDPGEDPKRSF